MTLTLGAYVFSQKSVQTNIYSNLLKPFTTDGCSFFPDGFGKRKKSSWRHCCFQHDIEYWKGGTLEQRRKADEDIKQCANEVFKNLGGLMYLVLRPGGSDSLPFSWRWGYGWVTPRANSELTDYENHLVDQFSYDFSQNTIVKKKLIEIKSSNPHPTLPSKANFQWHILSYIISIYIYIVQGTKDIRP